LQASDNFFGEFTRRRIHKTILTQRRKGAKQFYPAVLRELKLFLAPNFFQMRDAAGHGVERDFGA
jgi:hypothetical protein